MESARIITKIQPIKIAPKKGIINTYDKKNNISETVSTHCEMLFGSFKMSFSQGKVRPVCQLKGQKCNV